MIIKQLKRIEQIILIALLSFPLAGCEWEDQWGTIDDILGHIAKSYPAIERFLVAFCYVVGIWFVIAGFNKLKRYTEMRGTMMGGQAHIGGPLLYIFIGILLFYFPSLVNVMVFTVWGTTSIVQYPVTPPKWKYFTDPVIGLVRIVGYIAFIRGWILLVRLGQESHQPGTAGKALLHIFGGVLAINIVGTLNMLGATLA